MAVFPVREAQSIAPLFAGHEEFLLRSYFDGCMGVA